MVMQHLLFMMPFCLVLFGQKGIINNRMPFCLVLFGHCSAELVINGKCPDTMIIMEVHNMGMINHASGSLCQLLSPMREGTVCTVSEDRTVI